MARALIVGLLLSTVLGRRAAVSDLRAQQAADAIVFVPIAMHRIDADRLATPVLPEPTSPSPSGTPTPESTRPSPSPTAPRPSETPSPPSTCGDVPAFADGIEPQRVLHITVDGDDAGGDGTIERPYATIGRAAGEAVAGTALRVHAGDYVGGVYVEDLRGSADAPIWIGGAPGAARPVLNGGSVGIHLVRPAFVVVHDLEVTGPRNNGINADDGGSYDDPTAAERLVFRNVDIHDVGGSGNQDCLKLSGLNHFVVVDSAFARCGGGYSGSGIDLVGAHHGLIARNRFEDHAGNAVQAKGGSEDIEIRWNHMVRAGERAVNMGGSTGFDYFRPPLDPGGPNAEARNVRVVANLIEGGTTPLAFVGCVDCLAANNTVVDPERWLLRILQETTTRDGYAFEVARDGRLANNLYHFSRSQIATHVNIGGGTAPESFAFDHNLWYAHDDPSRSAPDLPVRETDAVVGRDPAFRSGYAIGPDSPAVGAGTRLPEVRGDITGRCYRDPPSIGAYEVP